MQDEEVQLEGAAPEAVQDFLKVGEGEQEVPV